MWMAETEFRRICSRLVSDDIVTEIENIAYKTRTMLGAKNESENLHVQGILRLSGCCYNGRVHVHIRVEKVGWGTVNITREISAIWFTHIGGVWDLLHTSNVCPQINCFRTVICH